GLAGELRGSAINRGVERHGEFVAVVVAAAYNIEVAAIALPRFPAQTSAACDAQVQILESIVFVVVEHVDEQTWGDVAVERPSAADGLSGLDHLLLASRFGQQTPRVDLVKVQRGAVIGRGAYGIGRGGKHEGTGIALSGGQADVEEAGPKIGDGRMEIALVLRLFGGVAHGTHLIEGNLFRACRISDFHLAGGGNNFPTRRLAFADDNG